MRDIRDICNKPGFWEFHQGRSRPQPFPGRYPTRWRLLFQKTEYNEPDELFGHSVVVFDVITKPNAAWIKRINKYCRYDGAVALTEFDKGGPIRACYRSTPRANYSLTQLAESLAKFYYPFTGHSGDFFEPWSIPCYSKLLTLGRRSFYIYSKFEKMDKEPQFHYLREYAQWLSVTKPWNALI